MTTVMMNDGQTMAPTAAVSMTRSPRTPVLPGVRAAPPGPAVLLRVCLSSDATRLRQLFERCTPATRYDRFHAALREIPPAYLSQVLSADPDVHDALVVEVQRLDPLRSPLVAIASAARVPSDRGSMVEIAVLVEDSWQGQGLGTWLLASLVTRARRRGIECARWCMLNQGRDLVTTLRREFGPLEVRRDGEVITAETSLERTSTTQRRQRG